MRNRNQIKSYQNILNVFYLSERKKIVAILEKNLI